MNETKVVQEYILKEKNKIEERRGICIITNLDFKQCIMSIVTRTPLFVSYMRENEVSPWLSVSLPPGSY